MVLLIPWRSTACECNFSIRHNWRLTMKFKLWELKLCQFHCFLPSSLCCYLFSKWNIYAFILDFSNPILFYLFLFLSPTSYLLPLPFFAYSLLSLSPSVSFFVCLLLSFLLSSIYLLWLSLFILNFLFLLLSLSLSSTFLLGFLLLYFFDCLPLFSPYSFLYLFVYKCFIFYCYFFYLGFLSQTFTIHRTA